MADGGTSPMTGNTSDGPSPRNTETVAALKASGTSRQVAALQQSSSLPSTPRVHARESSGSHRTPSPMFRSDAPGSPRSVRSESDTGLRPPGRTFLSGCRYETGMAFSKRRIPYSLGDERLERARVEPKKYLEPAEEDKLSGDMRELYDRLLPSPESEERRTEFVKKLERMLNDQWPGNDIKVHVFGSSGNMLCTSDSDVDICITTPMKALERVCLLAKALADHGMQRVVCIPQAKVPIVKIWDPELKLACDMNVNNTLALENTRMIRTYVQVDPRVRPLAMIIKYWTRRRILNDAALGGTLSSYTWICLVIGFLQNRSPPILPVLQQRPHQCLVDASGKRSPFADDVESLSGFGRANKETIGDLLFGFFRCYGHEFDFDRHVVSVREGKYIPKEAKKWHLMQNNRLCVEEPFNTDRNLANTADDNAVRGLHLEIRRAFDLLCGSRLGECCEQYVYPPQEEKFWTKPVPQPLPILSRSKSQNSRSSKGNGSSNGGGSHKGRHRAGTSNRRASSAAASNKASMGSLGQAGAPPGAGDRAAGNHIHDQLYQHYQMLQVQEAQLRMQMQQRAQATMHAQLTAQLQPLQVPSGQYSPRSDNRRRKSNLEAAPLSAPLRAVQALYYPVPTSNAAVQGSNMPGAYSLQHSSTSPPSPSVSSAQLAPSDPRRGGLRRSTNVDGTAMPRSHSQPPSNQRSIPSTPRSMPIGMYQASGQASVFGYPSLQAYQEQYLQAKRISDMQQMYEAPLGSPRLDSLHADRTRDEPNPQEYVGYYVDRGQMYQSLDAEGPLQPFAAFPDLVRHRRAMSPSVSRLRDQSSRSPSPVDSFRDRSRSLYSVASAPASGRPGRGFGSGSAAVVGPQRSGPIIIDGSNDGMAHSTPELFYAVHMGEAAPNPDGPPFYTPAAATDARSSAEESGYYAFDAEEGTRTVGSMPNVLQFGDFPVGNTLGPGVSPPKTNSVQPPSPRKEDQARSRSEERQEDMASNGLGIETVDPSSKDAAPRAQNPAPPPTLSGSLDGVPGRNLGSALKPLPLLSPVREVRTPSPTATKNGGGGSALFETQNRKAHGRFLSLSGKEALLSSPRASGCATTLGKGKGGAREATGPAAGAEPWAGPSDNALGGGARTGASGEKELPAGGSVAKTNGLSNGGASRPLAQQASGPLQTQGSGWQQQQGKKGRKKHGSTGNILLSGGTGERKGG